MIGIKAVVEKTDQRCLIYMSTWECIVDTIVFIDLLQDPHCPGAPSEERSDNIGREEVIDLLQKSLELEIVEWSDQVET